MRRVDIAHSGQTVAGALEQLVAAIKDAQRAADDSLLVVHGFGSTGVGGAIREAVVAELPRLSRVYGFRVVSSDSDKRSLPNGLNLDVRRLTKGSSLLVFRKPRADRESQRDFRPNFRNLKRVKVAPRGLTSAQKPSGCRHADRQLLARRPTGSTYRCRTCGITFLVLA